MLRVDSHTPSGHRFVRTTTLALVVALTVVVAGCSKQEQAAESVVMESAADKSVAGMPSAPPPGEPMVASDAAADAASMQSAGAAAEEAPSRRAEVEADTRVSPDQVASSATTYSDNERRFVRTAQAQFRVKDVYASALAIEDAAAQQGGFVVENRISAQTLGVQRRPAGDGKLIELAEYTVQGTLVVRVPSDNTQAFLRAIASQMEFLDQRNFQANDVQFDLLRRALARQREQQTQEELGEAMREGDRLDRKAEVIAARGDARMQRDEALVQQKEYEDRIAFSTINLSLYQLAKIRQTELVDTEAVFRRHGPGFFPRLFDALRVGWYGVLDLLIALLHVWPLWLALGIALYALRRWVRARRTTRTPPPNDTAD
jgi:hypothetical protein